MYYKYKKIIKCFVFTFLLYFLSINNIYANSSKNNEEIYLTPIGNVIQLDAELENIIVRNSYPGCPFQVGDYVLDINGIPVKNQTTLSDVINNLSKNQSVEVKIKRNNRDSIVRTDKSVLENINFNNLLSGFATLTYLNPKNKEFGAVAHPISLGNARKISIKSGEIYSTSNVYVEKSFRGNVGSISAQKENVIGNFNNNTEFGIVGQINNNNFSNLPSYKVAHLNEVKLDKAYALLQNKDNKIEKYEIEIVNIDNQDHPQSKTFKIKITDKRLLNYTGGVVQGMSGTPIIQNNKIIGAISHAIENDPSYGYAVYIGWMLKGDK